jgi:transcriptional regulator ATRX
MKKITISNTVKSNIEQKTKQKIDLNKMETDLMDPMSPLVAGQTFLVDNQSAKSNKIQNETYIIHSNQIDPNEMSSFIKESCEHYDKFIDFTESFCESFKKIKSKAQLLLSKLENSNKNNEPTSSIRINRNSSINPDIESNELINNQITSFLSETDQLSSQILKDKNKIIDMIEKNSDDLDLELNEDDLINVESNNLNEKSDSLNDTLTNGKNTTRNSSRNSSKLIQNNTSKNTPKKDNTKVALNPSATSTLIKENRSKNDSQESNENSLFFSAMDNNQSYNNKTFNVNNNEKVDNPINSEPISTKSKPILKVNDIEKIKTLGLKLNSEYPIKNCMIILKNMNEKDLKNKNIPLTEDQKEDLEIDNLCNINGIMTRSKARLKSIETNENTNDSEFFGIKTRSKTKMTKSIIESDSSTSTSAATTDTEDEDSKLNEDMADSTDLYNIKALMEEKKFDDEFRLSDLSSVIESNDEDDTTDDDDAKIESKNKTKISNKANDENNEVKEGDITSDLETDLSTIDEYASNNDILNAFNLSSMVSDDEKTKNNLENASKKKKKTLKNNINKSLRKDNLLVENNLEENDSNKENENVEKDSNTKNRNSSSPSKNNLIIKADNEEQEKNLSKSLNTDVDSEVNKTKSSSHSNELIEDETVTNTSKQANQENDETNQSSKNEKKNEENSSEKTIINDDSNDTFNDLPNNHGIMEEDQMNYEGKKPQEQIDTASDNDDDDDDEPILKVKKKNNKTISSSTDISETDENKKDSKDAKDVKDKFRKRYDSSVESISSNESQILKRRTRQTTAKANLSSSEGENITTEKKKKRKRVKYETSSNNNSDDSNGESDKEIIKKAKRTKKSSRNKNIKIESTTNSESDQENESDEKESDDDVIALSDEDKAENSFTRHKLHRLIDDKKLTKETLDAQAAERERKKRLEEKRKEEEEILSQKSQEAENKPDIVLEYDKETKQPLIKLDKNLTKVLKPHQVDGIKFMWENCYEKVEMIKKGNEGSGCILAHCMGLGKTLQVIGLVHTLIEHSEFTTTKRALIIVPKNVQQNWLNECEKWTKHLKFKLNIYQLQSDVAKGLNANSIRLNEIEKWISRGGLFVINYNMFTRLVTGKNMPSKYSDKYQNYLTEKADLVICDEGHFLKSDKSSLSKCVSQVKTKRRIVLTGTPLQNNLLEYYCMVSFVKPKLLGTEREFRNRFVNPINNGQHSDSTESDVKLMKKRAHILHNTLDGCVQRKDYLVIQSLLPKKREYVLNIRLSDKQIELYRAYLKTNGVDGIAKIKGAKLFTDFSNISRIISHPWTLMLNEDRIKKKEEKEAIKKFVVDDDEDVEEDLHNEPLSNDDNSNDVMELDDITTNKKRTRQTINGGGINNTDSGESSADRTKRWWSEIIDEKCQFDIEMSGKFYLLSKILEYSRTVGDKLLVFSQNLLSLDTIEKFLDHQHKQKINTWTKNIDYFRMDGGTEISKRTSDIDKFNDKLNKRARLFLISTKAGGIGINLVGANRCVIFDANWNPSHDNQSVYRIYRFGQQKEVFVYRFLAQGTMEEKIYQRQVIKQSLSQRVLDEHQLDRHFTSQELRELYAFEPDIYNENEPPSVHAMPDDGLLKELIYHCGRWLLRFHEHETLLENRLDEELSAEERQAAWNEYEAEKQFSIARAQMLEQNDFNVRL